MSTFEEIRPEFESSSKVKVANIGDLEGFYPLRHSGGVRVVLGLRMWELGLGFEGLGLMVSFRVYWVRGWWLGFGSQGESFRVSCVSG